MDPASMQKRLHDVAFPLLVATAEWCPFDQEPTYGFLLSDGEGIRTSGDEVVGRKVVVSYVHPRSPASSAGLEPDDLVIQVNTQDVTGRGADGVVLLVRRLTVARIQPLQLEILRAGERRLITLWAVPACQFSVQLIESDLINGISNGRQVGVTTGAMRFFRSNDELGWVLAHEIAHNVLSHVQSARLRAMLNAFLDNRGCLVGCIGISSAEVSRGPGGLCRFLYHGASRIRSARHPTGLASVGKDPVTTERAGSEDGGDPSNERRAACCL